MTGVANLFGVRAKFVQRRLEGYFQKALRAKKCPPAVGWPPLIYDIQWALLNGITDTRINRIKESIKAVFYSIMLHIIEFMQLIKIRNEK
jgi:hypothetical protein